MSVHTLYQPATVATASSVRKTQALTDAIAKLRGEADELQAQIDDIDKGNSPATVKARREHAKCENTFHDTSKETQRLTREISKTERQIAELTSSLATLRMSLTDAATAQAKADEQEKAAAITLTNTIKTGEAATAGLRKRRADRLGDVSKAEYRLTLHLARHPASALTQPPTTEVDSPAEP